MTYSDFTIMIVEDDLGMQKIYQKSLSSAGYKVVMAESGARALAELAETKADLLITDLKMKTMSALELLPILKKDYPRMPVIVVSGRYGGLLEDFNKKGFDNVKLFFQKPLSMDILKEKVRGLLKINDKGESDKQPVTQ